MKQKQMLLLIMFMLCGSLAFAQTKTVSKTGPADFTTVQDAINSFTPDPDPNTPNVIQIIDSSVYDEMITINVPITIEGTGASRPILAVRQNTGGDGNDGLIINIPTGTFNDVTLRNLIVIPSRTSVPMDDGIRSHGQNLNITLENILVTANNGSDFPVTLDGLAPVSLSGATQFGDDGIFVGAGTTPSGDGTVVTLRNVVVSHIQGAVPNLYNDGLICSSSGKAYYIYDGCVFSYCNRLGIQAAGDFQIYAPSKRVLVLGNKGFAGIWFAAASPSASPIRSIDGCNVIDTTGVNNSSTPGVGWGIEHQNGGTVNFVLRNAIIKGNTGQGLMISELAGSGSSTIENVTFAGNGRYAIDVNSAYAGTITINDCIIAGDGTADSDNVVRHNGTGLMNISYSALVTEGPFALLTPPTTGTGTINQLNIVNADPQFVETSDYTSDSFFDVFNPIYSAAGTGGTPLRGGADYVGAVPTPTPTPIPTPTPLAVNSTWSIYK